VKDYTLGIDVWEGSLEIDESLLLSKGVEFNLIRLNSIDGGHHKDENFDRQWAESVNQIRIPYFVYNPWRTGAENYAWLKANLPAGVTTIAPDIEVKRDGYSPDIYAGNVDQFIRAVRADAKLPINYTGLWFLPLLAYWPQDTEYWIARYPTSMYPTTATRITWEELKVKIANLTWYPGSSTTIPGPCGLWQCSGDRFILPGTNRTTDINLFNGTVDAMITRYKLPPVQVPARLRPVVIPEPIELSDSDKLTRLWAAHPELHH